MKLNEVSALSKEDLMISMIEKIISNQLGVHMRSVDAKGHPVNGRIWSISRTFRGVEVVYTEQNKDGTWEKNTASTIITPHEMEVAVLKKAGGGWYTFSFPNEEFDEYWDHTKGRKK